MNTVLKRIFPLAFLFMVISCNAPGGNDNTKVLIRTTAGDITIKLYDGTPLHRDNFIRLVNTGYYEGVSFHRVIKDFMIQAGDPLTRPGLTKIQIDSLSSYTIPAEIRKEYYHKKGALAAAREGNDVNPGMRSSGTQFYIVQGKKYTDQEIIAAAERINSNLKQIIFSRLIKEIADSAMKAGSPLQDSEVQEKASLKMFDYLTTQGDFKFTEEQIGAYKTAGGVPRLDGTYTVFGEVTEGLEVVDKIASVTTDASDKPVNDVKILKMKLVR